jgi:uncharacterized protein YciI
MKSRTFSGVGARRDDGRPILRAGQRSVCLRRSATRPVRPWPEAAPMTAAEFQRKLAELTGKMLRKKMFMVIFTSTVGMDKLLPLLPMHLEYMIELARKGVLFAAGPMNSETGTPTGGGMALFNTATADEARRYMEAEPFSQAGLRTFQVHEWVFMEGSMTVTLNFAESGLSVA